MTSDRTLPDRRRLPARALTLALALSMLAPLAPRTGEAAVARRHGDVPMAFERRDGTATEFVARGQGYHVRVSGPEAAVVLQAPRERVARGPRSMPEPGVTARGPADVIRISLLGAAPGVAEPEGPQGRVHYLVGDDPGRWRTNVPTYARVWYRGVYPGVDLLYYGNQRRLEYDLVVAPGADPGAIRVSLTGGQGTPGRPALRVDAAGDLVVATAAGDVRLRRPVVYQEAEGARRPVPATWVVHAVTPGTAPRAELGFELAAYDRTRPLVIDPVLDYSTYLGGAGGDAALAVAVDGEGHAYVAGYTESADFPDPAGSGDARRGLDAFVTRIAPDGQSIAWSAYVGGDADDVATGVAVDAAGNVYLAGYTDSADLPTAGAYQDDRAGTDAFLAKISADGTQLLYGTYLGGGDTDVALAVAVGAGQHAYVTGYTASTDFPRVSSLHGDKPLTDGFVVRLDTMAAGGASLVWSSYLGGNADDQVQAVAVDAAGRVHVVGWTDSTNFPKVNYYLSDRAGRDGFLATLDPAGPALLYSTYIAGNGDDEALGVAVDASGYVHVAGVTASTNFPHKHAVRKDPAGGSDAFVSVFDPAATGADSLVASTYLGGAGDDAALAIAVGPDGRAVVTGSTTSANFPVQHPLSGPRGSADAFVAKVDLLQDGPGILVFSSPMGGSASDAGNAVAIDATGAAIVAGTTASVDFPTRHAFGPLPAGADDAFVARLSHLDDGGPDLVVTSLAVPGGVDASGALVVHEATKNQGGSPAAASTTRFYLSTDATLDDGDLVLGARTVPELEGDTADTAATTLAIPATLPGGTYHVFARADADDAVVEEEEGNNQASATVALGADLVVTAVSAPAAGAAGGNVTVTATVLNAGARPAAASTAKLYLSADAVLDAGDVLLGSRVTPELAAGAAAEVSTAVTIPVGTATGAYRVLAHADADQAVAETSEANNVTASGALAIGADLAVTEIAVPAVSAPGAVISVTDTTVNTGGGAAPASLTRFYLSADPVLDAGDTPLGSRAVPALAAGAASTGTTTLTVPSSATASFYLIARANASGAVVETETANNAKASTLVQVGGDLVAWAELPSSARWAPAGGTLVVNETTKNEGLVAVPASTTRVYLSTDTALDASDLVVGSRSVPPLQPGQLSAGTVTAAIPASIAGGTWYVLVKADGDGALAETDETNNFVPPARDVLIGADLVVALDVPGSAAVLAPGAVVTVNDVTRNASNVPAGASTTRFYLSADQVLDAGDVLVGSRAVPALAPDSASAGTTSITVPADASGLFHVIARADADGAVVEHQEGNNVAVSLPMGVGTDLTAWVALPNGAGWVAAGGSVPVEVTTRNLSTVPAPPSTTRIYLSTDDVIDDGDLVLGDRPVPALAAGATDAATLTVTVPAAAGGGLRHVLVRANADGTVLETSTANNFTPPARALLVGADLVIAIDLPGSTSVVAPGATLSVGDVTRNASNVPAAASTTRFYLSADAVLDESDVPVGSRSVPALAPDTSSAASTAITLPPGLSGTFHVLARANADGAVIEHTETNNTAVSQPLTIGADLTAWVALPNGSGWAVPGTAIPVEVTTKNLSTVGAGASTTGIYLSADAVLDAGDVLIGTRPVAPLGAGGQDTATVEVLIPAGAAGGLHHVLVRADAGGAIVESDEANNFTPPARTVLIGADLVVALDVPGSATVVAPGATITVADVTRNTSNVPAGPSTTRFYLSADQALDAGDVPVGSRSVPALAPDASSSGTTALALPPDLAGAFYVLARADGDDAVTEHTETNNTAVSLPLTVGPDLAAWVSLPNGSGWAPAGGSIQVSLTTMNVSTVAAGASTTAIYLSADEALDAGDTLLATRPVGPLAGSGTDTATLTVTLPASLAGGVHYVLARANHDGAVADSNPGNDFTPPARPVLVGADLQVDLDVPGSAAVLAPGATLVVNDVTRNASNVEAGPSTTRFYLSADQVLDAGDVPVGSRPVPALAPDTSSAGSTTITLPADLGGAHYLIAAADGDGAVVEHTETNNTDISTLLTVGTDLTAWVALPNGSAWSATGGSITVSVTTKNLSTIPAGASTTTVYLSADQAVDASDLALGSIAVPALEGGGTSTTTMPVEVPAGLAGGTYYVVVRANSDGAVNDANPGNDFTPPARALLVGADLIVTLDVSGAAALVAPGDTIALGDVTRNASQVPAGASVTRFYLSADPTLDAGDVLLGERAVPALDPDSASQASTLVTLPAQATGSFYILAVADAGGAVAEHDEGNNVFASAPIAVGADLAITGLTAPASVAGGATIHVSDTTKNLGAAAAPASMTRFYLSADAELDASDLLLAARPVPALEGRAYHSATTALVVPGTIDPGTYRLLAVADGGGDVDEVLESNNVWVHTLDVLADLQVAAISAPSKAYPGAEITVTDTTRSRGALAPETTTAIVLSTDTAVDEGDLLLGFRTVPALAYGEESVGSLVVALPAALDAGTYYLIAVADADGAVSESSESNNTRYKALTIGPDLRVTSLSVPSAAAPGQTIVASDTTTNLGSAAGATRTFFYLSANNALDAGDVLLGVRDVPALGLNEASAGSVALTLPGTAGAGTWYVIAVADGDGAVAELNENNNTRSRALSLAP